MTIEKLIDKFDLRLIRRNGKEGIGVGRKATQKQMAELKAKKEEILAELKRQENERLEAEARKEAERQEEIRAIREGEKTIKVRWYDGMHLNGWGVFGPAAELLEEIGLAKPIAGWGHCVDDKAVNALGKEFTYQQAVEYTQPAREAKAQAKAAAEQEREEKYRQARETGKPVLLRKWTEPCNNPHEECSIDIVKAYAMPDGTQKTERVHTY